jgi:hypothetical protein
MHGNTEIYVCKPGQAIKDGAVEVSNIQTRDEARADAERRFKHDKSIGKIAYYKVKEDGTFKSIFSMESPMLAANQSAKQYVAVKGIAKKGAKAKAAKKSRKTGAGLFGKLRSLFES